jgi:hypothetical protein
VEANDQFYEKLERAHAACPSHDVKLMMGDAFASGRQMAIKSTYFIYKKIQVQT